MAFVKEFRNYKDEMPEWEYFNSLGIRTRNGKVLSKHTYDVVVDRERNYYLKGQGHVGNAHQDEDISFYTLILDGLRIALEVTDAWCNDSTKQYIENHWYLKKIDIIDEEIKEKFSKEEIIELIREAFVAESVIDPEIPKKRGIIEIKFDNVEIKGI